MQDKTHGNDFNYLMNYNFLFQSVCDAFVFSSNKSISNLSISNPSYYFFLSFFLEERGSLPERDTKLYRNCPLFFSSSATNDVLSF
jgi:hypothetical protein